MTAGARSFQVWAPYATRGVELDLDGQRHPMTAGGDGWWWVEAPADPGRRYGFRIDGGPVLPDPRAQSLPDGPNGPAEVVAPVATNGARATADESGGAHGAVRLDGAVCYQLSVPACSAEGTFDGVAERLDHLAELGVELLLLGSVAGYDARAPLVVEARYGGPRRLAALVQACHARGIGVGVDLVLGWPDLAGSPLNNFAPYLQAAPDTASGWAPNLDGPDSDGVRAFWLATALHWLGAYELDALRLADAGSLVDRRALTFVEELGLVMAELSAQSGRPRWLIADDDRLDPRTVAPIEAGGVGCAAVPAPDVGRGIWQAITGPPDRVTATLRAVLGDPFWAAGAYSTRHGRSNGRTPGRGAVPGWRFLTGLAGSGVRASGLAEIGARRWCCAAALSLTSATTPLLTLGEEWGLVPGEAVAAMALDWSAGALGDGPRLFSWYRALLALRTARPELRDPDLSGIDVRDGDQPGVAVVHRGSHRIAVNLGRQSARVDLGLETSHRQVVLLSLDPTTAVSDEGTLELSANGVAVVGPASNPGGAP